MRICCLLLCIFVLIAVSDSSEGNDVKDLLFKSAIPGFTKHEIIKPVVLKKSSDIQGGKQDEILIQFSAFSKNFTLELKRNANLFSKSYVEKGFTSEGEDINRPAIFKGAHCFYHGYIRDHLSSMVALSICDGISGYIYDGQESYHLEPAFDISPASHRLYKDSDTANKHPRHGAHPYEQSRKNTKINSSETYPPYLNKDASTIHIGTTGHTHCTLPTSVNMRRDARELPDFTRVSRFVEMYVVNDFTTFESNGRNLTRQIQRTQNIINIVNTLYRPLNIFITLVGIENWTLRDFVSISAEAEVTLNNFLHYRRARINSVHPNDNAQLIMGTHFEYGVVGKALKGTICTHQYSGGVNLNLATEGQTAALIAHTLGHNLGMEHDDYSHCHCTEDKCIMAPTSAGFYTPNQWSSCSKQTLQEQFDIGMDYCLLNKPDELIGVPVCGNGLTEEGEECDCGLPQDCVNNCCNASTCKLNPESKCATGLCCDLSSCQPLSEATLCRVSVGECDLPEFCSGDSQRCPDDVHLQNGVECDDGQSYCYNGQCKTHAGQCQLLWGTTGHVSDQICFKKLNTRGSSYGNCGYNWTTDQYLCCLKDNVMCGLLHCDHQNEKLIFWKESLALATPTTFLTVGPKSYKCSGAVLDVGLNMPDPGMVPDGAKCGEGKICVKQRCTTLSALLLPTCQDDCSGKGVCNSRGHCHCDEGFAPPTCNSSGHGGSVDSGPSKIPDCEKNYSLAHGTVKYKSNMRSYNQTAAVACDKGYEIEGDPEITCQADGTWSENTICREKTDEGTLLNMVSDNSTAMPNRSSDNKRAKKGIIIDISFILALVPLMVQDV